MHRLDLLARAGAGEEDAVNTGVLIRLEALFRFGNAPTAQGTRAAKDDQGGVLTRGHGSAQFPSISSVAIKPSPCPPKGVGSTVSSIVSAATPEVSNSSTVRMTFSALP